MKTLKRIQPWPWYVAHREFSQSGKLSRPRIMDANHKPLSLSKTRQLTLAAMAPILLDRLANLVNKAEMMHLQVQSELAVNLPEPHELTLARQLVRIAERLGA